VSLLSDTPAFLLAFPHESHDILKLYKQSRSDLRTVTVDSSPDFFQLPGHRRFPLTFSGDFLSLLFSDGAFGSSLVRLSFPEDLLPQRLRLLFVRTE